MAKPFSTLPGLPGGWERTVGWVRCACLSPACSAPFPAVLEGFGGRGMQSRPFPPLAFAQAGGENGGPPRGPLRRDFGDHGAAALLQGGGTRLSVLLNPRQSPEVSRKGAIPVRKGVVLSHEEKSSVPSVGSYDAPEYVPGCVRGGGWTGEF